MSKRVISKIITYILLIMLLIVSVGPFLWLVSTSLKSPEENIFSNPPKFLPQKATLENLQYVLTKIPFGTYFFNSTLIAVITVVLNIVLSIMAAYPLERMEFKGKKAIFLSVLSTMMIPFQVTMIPIYVTVVNFKMKDTFTGVIVPFAVGAFGIFLIRQAFRSVPRSLDEAAYIDGCNTWQILWKVLVPLIMPSIATLAIFTFVNSWSNFLWPLLVLSDKKMFTLPLGLIDLQGTFTTNWRLVAAGAVLSTAPIIIFFAATQKYFIEGVADGGVKG